ncbi:MAG: YggT family protein [Thermoleophilia bacterium]
MSKTGILGFLDALFWIYYALIFVRVIFSWVGLPSQGTLYEIFRFVYNVTEPYLGIFRRFIPAAGAIDFSPFVGMIVLMIIHRIAAELIVSF